MAISYNPKTVTDGLVLALDAANPKSYSTNVFTYPLDAFAWAGPGGGYQMTLTRDSSITDSPVGGTPLKIVTSGAAAYTGTYNSPTWNLAPAVVGQTWTFSFWVKGTTAHSASLMIFEANSAGNYTALGQYYYNVTTSWTRVSGSYTMTQGTTAFVQTRIDNYNTGVTMWVDGLQLEKTSSASNFNPLANINGTQWQDLSGNQRNATVNGSPTFTNGYFDITGDSTYISIPNAGLVPRTDNFTYSCWINFDAFDSEDTIFENGSWTDTLLFRYQSNANIAVYSEGVLYGSFAWVGTIGVWYNIVFRRENNTASCYINNNLTGTTFAMAVDINLANPNLWLMRSQHAINQFTNGKISNFSIYNKALSATEIQQNFNALRGRYGI